MSNMKIGIVGLPNVGKSTLFTALTKKRVDAENYPFCTIEPNIGLVPVPDNRLQELGTISHSENIVPTVIEFVDIAGLVKGAHKGEGLGNQFLSHIKEVDAIVQVVRAFHNTDITHVDGSIDPKRDQDTISLELAMSDLVLVNKRIDGLEGKARTGDKDAQAQLRVLSPLQKLLDNGTPAREAALSTDDHALISHLNLLTLKPMMLVYNVTDVASEKIQARAGIALNIQTEAELMDVPDDELPEYLRELGLDDTGLNKLIHAAYELLNLITFFTSGEQETRAWTVPRGATAPKAAGQIHSDMEKGFIRAEIINEKDFVASNGWNSGKEKGLVGIEGKEYVIQDGDVCYFRFDA